MLTTGSWSVGPFSQNDLVGEVREDLTRGLKVCVVVVGFGGKAELKSLLHSVFHEDEIKRNVRSKAVGGEFSFMDAPKVQFAQLDEQCIKASMVLIPAN